MKTTSIFFLFLLSLNFLNASEWDTRVLKKPGKRPEHDKMGTLRRAKKTNASNPWVRPDNCLPELTSPTLESLKDNILLGNARTQKKLEEEEKRKKTISYIVDEIKTTEIAYELSLGKLILLISQMTDSKEITAKEKKELLAMKFLFGGLLGISNRIIKKIKEEKNYSQTALFIKDQIRQLQGIYKPFIDSNISLQNRLQEIAKKTKNSSDQNQGIIADGVIGPIQRLPRYLLLLKEIDKKETDPDAIQNIKESIESIRKFLYDNGASSKKT